MKKLMGVLLMVLLLCNFTTNSYSWGGHYHYRGGHYYHDAGWWGFGGLMTGLAVGAYVASLPPEHETVVIDGSPYYYSDGYYYQSGPNGYVVVTPPASEGQSLPGPAGNNTMVSIIEILLGIVLLLGIGVLLKKLFMREHKTA